MPNIEDMSHEVKLLMIICGTMDELAELGLVSGQRVTSVRGTAAFDQLKASGFRPTTKEIYQVLTVFGEKDPKKIEQFTTLILGYLNGLVDEWLEEQGDGNEQDS